MVTNECVDIPNFGPGTIDGPVLQYYCNLTNSDNQLFYLDYAGTNSSSRTLYTIRNVKDGLCLDVPGFERVSAGTLVSEYHCDRSSRDNQAFYLGSNGWIVNDKSELCLDVDGVRSGGPGARITLYHCRLDDDHRWKIIDGVA
ncbi:Ricin-type beta-trefoil lectin domain-containing protein [Actinoplanes philippinensis]|uniref:Ricin-type beta-trefoil lectin domain-containing protein n=2 Tax=Actinoplanes philippinensis TaxID=35752 RepID=A0A1I2KP10_9ACTN|nr:Ricin-type beta-trefoil lectin domain-containing protein [Actinoplanes philippinensis]